MVGPTPCHFESTPPNASQNVQTPIGLAHVDGSLLSRTLKEGHFGLVACGVFAPKQVTGRQRTGVGWTL